MPSLRNVAACALAALLAACTDPVAPPPPDAAHVVPSDLGAACGYPTGAGCNAASDILFGRCKERCIVVGNWPGLCSGYCQDDSDCRAPAPYCRPLPSGKNACTPAGDPDMGCPDAATDGPDDAATDA